MSFNTFIDLDCLDFYLSDLETKDSDTKASARYTLSSPIHLTKSWRQQQYKHDSFTE